MDIVFISMIMIAYYYHYYLRLLNFSLLLQVVNGCSASLYSTVSSSSSSSTSEGLVIDGKCTDPIADPIADYSQRSTMTYLHMPFLSSPTDNHHNDNNTYHYSYYHNSVFFYEDYKPSSKNNYYMRDDIGVAMKAIETTDNNSNILYIQSNGCPDHIYFDHCRI